MRALAEFIMRGRVQAMIVAAISFVTAFFAWIGVAAVALVFLRKGLREGGYLLMWAILPAAVIVKVGMDVGPLFTLLIGVLGAVVLRLSVSWPLALMAMMFGALLLTTLLLAVGDSYLVYIQEMLKPVFEQMAAKQPEQAIAVPSIVMLAGMLGVSFATVSVLCLLLARGWQSQLYNPGGLREEMHHLRLAPWHALVCVIATGLAFQAGADYRLWALLCALPLTVAGFALCHGMAALNKASTAWLFMLYGLWLLSDWFKLLIIVLACLDSVMNFRARLQSQRPE